MQKVFLVIAKFVELLLSWIERTWFGSVVDAIIGRELVGAALYGFLRYLNAIQLRISQNRP